MTNRPSCQSTRALGQCSSSTPRVCCMNRRTRRGSLMTRPSSWGSWRRPTTATAPLLRSAPRWRARRMSESRLTTSPASSSSMSSPRRRASVSTRVSSRRRSTSSASASAGRATSPACGASPHSTITPTRSSTPSLRRRMTCPPFRPAASKGPSSDAGPCVRASSMASASWSSRASVRRAVPSTSRYSSRIATGPPSSWAAASAMPGVPWPVMSTCRNTSRTSASRPCPLIWACTAPSTWPQGRSSGMTMTGTFGVPDTCTRVMTATTPCGSALGTPPGDTSSAASSGRAAGSSSTSAVTRTPSAEPSGTTAAPSSAGRPRSSTRGRPASGAGVAAAFARVLERVLTPQAWRNGGTRTRDPGGAGGAFVRVDKAPEAHIGPREDTAGWRRPYSGPAG